MYVREGKNGLVVSVGCTGGMHRSVVMADELQDRLTDIHRSGVRVAIFRLKRTHSIDSTVMNVLERFIREMQEQDRHVLLCGVRSDVLQVLKAYGLVALLGKENVFETGQGLFVSVKKAIERARKLLGGSIDASGIDMSDDEVDDFSYEI
jgi:anti-anti-sigma regulatory factor